jgi:hypothetical protein
MTGAQTINPESTAAHIFRTGKKSVILSGASRGIMREAKSKDPDEFNVTITA